MRCCDAKNECCEGVRRSLRRNWEKGWSLRGTYISSGLPTNLRTFPFHLPLAIQDLRYFVSVISWTRALQHQNNPSYTAANIPRDEESFPDLAPLSHSSFKSANEN
jgi:hypothetical protein